MRKPFAVVLWSFVLSFVILFPTEAWAAPPRVRVIDSATGVTIGTETRAAAQKTASNGRGERVDIERPGFRPMQVRADDLVEGAQIDVYLDRETPLRETSVEEVARLRRANAMLVQGFVVDDEAGAPLAGVAVEAPESVAATTDARGFFRMYVPVRARVENGRIAFRLRGYESLHRTNVELWPYGDWVYLIRLKRGSGTTTVDEAQRGIRASHRHGDELPGTGVQSTPVDPELSFRMVGPASSAEALESTVPIPDVIRVGRLSTGGVDYRRLEDYCKVVLSGEWIVSWGQLSNGMESLRAGAVAIRTYAIGFIRSPYASTYDICDTTSCQVYDPVRYQNSQYSVLASSAVEDTRGRVLLNASGGIEPRMAEYSSENNSLNCYRTVNGVREYIACTCPDGQTGNCIPDPPCRGEARFGHGRGMCQYGSAAWATGLHVHRSPYVSHGYGTKNWQSILTHYYPNLTLANGRPFQIGDSVRAATDVRVRACSDGGISQGTNCPSIATRAAGSTGSIIAGPEWIRLDTSTGNGYQWWKIRWSDGVEGWSVENYLRGEASSGGGDTTPPVVSSFAVTPATLNAGGTVTASYAVSDSGGSGLSRVELWRATDLNGQPSGWQEVAFNWISGNGPVSGNFYDTPSAGTYWYGLHVLDQAGKIGYEPNPPGPVRVAVQSQTPACTSFTISPQSAAPTSASGSQLVNLTGSPSGCQGGNWSAYTNAGWLHVSPGSGSGSQSVIVSWDPNGSTSARNGTAFIGGAAFDVSQSGAAVPVCTSFTITPASIGAPAAAGSQYVTVSGSPAGCAGGSWTAAGNGSWASVSPGSGSGSGAVTVSWSANSSSSSRSTSVTIAGQACTMTQQGVTAAAKKGDFNADGRSEVLWRHADDSLAMWELDGRTLSNGGVFARVTDPNWKILGFGDFNADGYEDVFYRHAWSGDTAMSLMRGRTIIESSFSAPVPDMTWQMHAVGDFHGDGRDELIWRNTVTGDVAMWEVSGSVLLDGRIIYNVPDPGWQIQLAADFDGDGRDELLWRHTSNAMAMWDLQGRTLLNGSTFATVSSVEWQIITAGDYNRDGRADLLWRHHGTDMVAMWEMNHRTIVNGNVMFTVPKVWQAERSGDYDGDGDDEVLWHHGQTGEVAMWELSGHTLLDGSVFYRVTDLNWEVQPRGGIRPALDSH